MTTLAPLARQRLGLTLTDDQCAAFRAYAETLIEWNRRFNLTAITEPEGVQVKHFLDSLTSLTAIRKAHPALRDLRLIDVGTGAGFPGLPLKIACPQIRLTLVEATGKKVMFLEHVVTVLKLDSVTVIKARAEAVGQDPAHREKYDWAVARAVAEMPTLAEYLLPLVKVGGKALALKGESAPAEAQTAEAAIALLGGHLSQLLPVELPGVAETRYLVVLDKVARTPAKYPRRAGVPRKAPLV